MGSLLRNENEKERKEWERSRLGWFFSMIAPGLSKIKEPSELMKFGWEAEAVKEKKISKEKAQDIGAKLEKMING